METLDQLKRKRRKRASNRGPLCTDNVDETRLMKKMLTAGHQEMSKSVSKDIINSIILFFALKNWHDEIYLK